MLSTRASGYRAVRPKRQADPIALPRRHNQSATRRSACRSVVGAGHLRSAPGRRSDKTYGSTPQALNDGGFNIWIDGKIIIRANNVRYRENADTCLNPLNAYEDLSTQADTAAFTSTSVNED